MKKFLKYIPFQLTFFLIIGILIDKYFLVNKQEIMLINIVLLVWFGISYWIDKSRFYYTLHFTISTWVFALLLGLNTAFISNDLNSNNHYSNGDGFSISKEYRMVLVITNALKSSRLNDKFEANLIQLETKKTYGKILVHSPKGRKSDSFLIGDQIIVNATLQNIPRALNPYVFDYKKYLANLQIHHQVFIDIKQKILVKPGKITANGLSGALRKRIQENLVHNGFVNRELDLLNALLLGQRQHMDQGLVEEYSKAGAIHILAVSGLHIGIIYIILSFLLRPLLAIKDGRLLRLIVVIVLLWFYAFIAGLSVSVVRSVTMFTAVGIGIFLNRKSSVYQGLIISLFVLLLFNPGYLFMVGFQMSYLAVFFIVWIQPKFSKIWQPSWKPVHKLWNIFTLSLAAQIGVLPLSIYYFHQFPGLFFLSNLVIIPFLGAILLIGFLIIFCTFFTVVPNIILKAFQAVLTTMNSFVGWIARQDTFFIEQIGLSFLVMICIYGIIICFFKWTERKSFNRIVSVLLLVIVLQGVVFTNKILITGSTEFIVFHKYASSLLAIRNGKNIELFEDVSVEAQHDYLVNPYLLNVGGAAQINRDTIPNLIRFNNRLILTIDQEGIFEFENIRPDLVVLRNAPKINLDRLLTLLNPKQIVADGSNYRSDLDRWEQTCKKRKTPFFSTSKKGAFILKN